MCLLNYIPLSTQAFLAKAFNRFVIIICFALLYILLLPAFTALHTCSNNVHC